MYPPTQINALQAWTDESCTILEARNFMDENSEFLHSLNARASLHSPRKPEMPIHPTTSGQPQLHHVECAGPSRQTLNPKPYKHIDQLPYTTHTCSCCGSTDGQKQLEVQDTTHRRPATHTTTDTPSWMRFIPWRTPAI